MPLVSEVKKSSRGFKLIVYGERPITELFLTLATDVDIYALIDKIRLADGTGVCIDRRVERIEQIIVEAPLGKAYGCVDFVVFTTNLGFFFEVKPTSYEEACNRLDNQLPRYYNFINARMCLSRSDLARKIHKIVKSKKRNYIICITHNHNLNGLGDIYSKVEGANLSIIGWAPYSEIMMILKNNGFEILDFRSQIWAEEQ